MRGVLVKAFLAVAGLAVLAGVAWRVYEKVSASSGGEKKERPAVAVETGPVTRRALSDTAGFTGTLVARSQFVVAPKIPGRLIKLFVDIGDHVERGSAIAVLDEDEAVLAVEQAKAEVQVAKANADEAESALEVARREFERVEALRKRTIASEAELDAARAQLRAREARQKVALAQVEQKQSALEGAMVRKQYTRIKASWDEEVRPDERTAPPGRNGGTPPEGGSGVASPQVPARRQGAKRMVVGERFADEGAMLAANAPLVSLLDVEAVTAIVYVTERDHPRMKIGLPAVIRADGLPGEPFPGRIVRVAPLLQEASRQARVEIEVPNPREALRPGMFARVDVLFETHPQATVVPVTALVRRGSRQGVFLVKDSADGKGATAEFREVRTGFSEGDVVEILEPEISGSVVTLGGHLVEDGSALKVVTRSAPGESRKAPAGKGPASDATPGPGARPGEAPRVPGREGAR